MKDIFYKRTVVAVALFFCSVLAFAQSERNKEWDRTFDLSQTGKVRIENKYGNVVVNGWDKEQVKVSVSIQVRHRKDENAVKLLDRIQPKVVQTGNFIQVISEIGNRNSGFFAKYFNKANPFDFDKSNVQIDYEVYLPQNTELDIANKFGDIIIDSWTGDLEITLQHGDIWVNEDISTAKIDMRFGKINARDMDYGNIKMDNGRIDVESAQKMKIISSGSDVHLGKVADLELYSSKDEVVLEEIGDLRGDFKFSNADIENVTNEIFLTLRVAEVQIQNVMNPDAEIDIVQESSEINMNISGLSFEFSATLEQGLLRVPKTFSNVKTHVTNEGRKIRDITATYGTGKKGDFSINGIKGIIILTD
ncbi:hypothetical protein [Flagellimonas nanhaiensis]|uniref:Adhesin domain-containing protein n=1 Tax=Flagellimonas nanhaiensis TaxID=2292706 RepID=A0A371JRN1_9FLAO|nr:hypothetical protein [Allomuricauda nanhaiensis]RDY60172.1 hypothetical protein DX873_12650 [Allomuricauda nanhaiensis]